MSEEVNKESVAIATFTEVEKEGLAKDLTALANTMMGHDQYIFQLVAAVNVIQDVLVKAQLTTEEQLTESIGAELKRMRDEFKAHMEKQAAEAAENEAKAA